VTIEGTYAVNPDCTGSMTLNVSFSDGSEATVHADLVIDDGGAELRAIVTEAGVVESRVYRKQFREGREESAKLTPGARQLLPSLSALASAQLSRVFKLTDLQLGIGQLGPTFAPQDSAAKAA
jgi:hypothetical protein